jgi:hypothetical protein
VAEPPAVQPWHSDGWIALALCDARRDAWISLETLVGDADHWNHAILTFDEVSFGLARLWALGLAEVRVDAGRVQVRATALARARRRTVHARTLGDALNQMARAIGASPWPGDGEEDRSQGRLPGITEAAFNADVRAYHRQAFGIVEALFAGHRAKSR